MSFRIPHSRFAKSFLDDFLRRLLQTRPHPFVFRPRPTRSFRLVLWRQTAHHILRRSAIGVTRRDVVYGSETDFSDLVWANVWMFVRNRRQECEHDGGISASINIPPTTLSIF